MYLYLRIKSSFRYFKTLVFTFIIIARKRDFGTTIIDVLRFRVNLSGLGVATSILDHEGIKENIVICATMRQKQTSKNLIYCRRKNTFSYSFSLMDISKASVRISWRAYSIDAKYVSTCFLSESVCGYRFRCCRQTDNNTY